MKRISHHRRGRIAVVLLIAGLLAAAVVYWFFLRPSDGTEGKNDSMLLHQVELADFEAFVTEPGEIKSSSNIEIRCDVEAKGGAGTTIIEIVPEGTEVVEGDFLIQLDDSVLKNDETSQLILVANDEALLEQAKSNLATAEKTLVEYIEGLFYQEKETFEGELFAAEEAQRRAEASLKHGERLAARGFITQLQLQSEQFALAKAKRDAAAARRKVQVYEKYTRDKLVGQYEADITRLIALNSAAENTLKLSNQRLSEVRQQIENCRIVAPGTGQVVYVSDQRRDFVVEEGAVIRDKQLVIVLPDTSKMQVDVRINESHVNRIREGQAVNITLDADPDKPLKGVVKEVSTFPFPRRWHGEPLEFGTTVTILDPPESIRPGLRAKVNIKFDNALQVLQVPLAAVIEHKKHHFCLVRSGSEWDVRTVTIGKHNNSDVVIQAGLDAGERVSMSPFQFIQRADLPDLGEPEELASGQPAADEEESQQTQQPEAAETSARTTTGATSGS